MKLLKRIIAVALVSVIALTTTACYSQDKTWAMKQGENVMSIGTYIYYLFLGYDSAAQMVDDKTEVLKATIDGKDVTTYIHEKAYNYCQSYFWIDQKIQEINKALTEEEINGAKSMTQQQWQYFGPSLEAIGVSQDSFTKAYSEYNIKFKKVFDHYYGAGGEREIPKQEILDYYSQNKYSYSYMFAPLTKTDAEKAAVPMTEAERTALEEQFAVYKKQVETGYYTVEAAAQDYMITAKLQEAPVTTAVNDLKYEYYPTSFVQNLQEMKTGEVRSFESDGNLILLQKFPIEDAAKKMYDLPAQRLATMLEIKSEEFNGYLAEVSAKEIKDLTLNKGGMDSVSLKNLVLDNNKMGTKKTESNAPKE